MITRTNVKSEEFDLEKLQEVLRLPGPCITVLIPPYHPGEPTGSRAALLRANLQDATRQLGQLAFPKTAAEDLLEPIGRLANDSAWLGGAHLGCALFRSPEIFHQLPLTLPAKAALTVAGCFAIRHLLPELLAPKPFYILSLSKESIGLFRYFESHAQAVKLPGGTPMTLRDALQLEPPDHDLENRSAAGPTVGGGGRIRFGTGSGSETEHAHLADFYKLVDREIQSLLRAPGIPLILAGVVEDVSVYRAISGYANLVKERLPGDPEVSLTSAETVAHAQRLLRERQLESEVKALSEARERTGRIATEPDVIAHAAFDGRVHELYVGEDSISSGVFDKRGYQSWGSEDMLNFSAVQTMLHRGKAFELPSNMMPVGTGVIAVLRY